MEPARALLPQGDEANEGRSLVGVRGEEWLEDHFERITALVRKDPAAFPDPASLAKAAGVNQTTLSSLFRHHAQESPSAFLLRTRVNHACSLLATGAKPVDVCAACGFAGSSAYQRQFTLLKGMSPVAYAALGTVGTFTLRLPPNYAAREVLGFHSRDPEGVCEQVSGSRITKGIHGGVLTLQLDSTAREASCEFQDLDGFVAHQAAVRMLGLGQDAAGFERQFAADALLGPLIRKQAGLRIPLSASPWEGLAWAIIGQQIGLGFAISLRRRLILLAGTQHESGLYSHPTPAAVAGLTVDALKQIQFSKSKAEYLIETAGRIAVGDLDLEALRDRSATRAARILGKLRGIGPWTVDYVFLRGLGFPDSLPSGDAGIAQGLHRLLGTRPREKEIRELTARFSPWRSLAAAHIWASLHGDKAE